MRAARYHDHTGGCGQPRQQEVDQKEVAEMVDAKCALEAIGGERLFSSALHAGVANQRMHGRQVPRVQALADFIGELSHRPERSQVKAHGFHASRGAGRLRRLAQALDRLLRPDRIAASQDNVPRAGT
jgi:hypothetical protein